jgi:hypothetical protein
MRKEAKPEMTVAERQAIWSRIKADAPEAAEFLTAINEAFGKPKRTAVWIGEERVL